MILSYLKDRFRLYHAWTAMASAQTYYNHVNNVRLLPEFDGYIPYVGENAEGDLREPTEAEFKAAFQVSTPKTARSEGGTLRYT